MKKLKLNKVAVSKLDQNEMGAVKGGFLSIGFECSLRNRCSRQNTKTWGYIGETCGIKIYDYTN